jgi:hypothetical protein
VASTDSADPEWEPVPPATVALPKGMLFVPSRSVLYYRARADLCNSWCGKGTDYCSAPDCQLDYGSGCDGVSTGYNTLARGLS